VNPLYTTTRLLSRCRNPGNISPLVGRGKPHIEAGGGTERRTMMDELTPFVPEDRPEFVEDTQLRFLDELRESGAVNMFGASPYLREMYPELSKAEARQVLGYWMKTFGEER